VTDLAAGPAGDRPAGHPNRPGEHLRIGPQKLPHRLAPVGKSGQINPLRVDAIYRIRQQTLHQGQRRLNIPALGIDQGRIR